MNKLLAALVIALPLAFASHPAAALEAGKDYQTLSPALATDSKGKVEVIEFFWYKCPHCFQFEPDLNQWARKLPKDVILKRQPAVLSDKWEPLARVYYALEMVGAADRLHDDVFEVVQIKDLDLDDPDTFFDWAAKQGVDRAKLKDAYNSFAVATKVARAKQLTRAYKLNGVPAMAVNGKYVTSAYMTGSHPKTLEAVEALIAKERGNHTAAR